MDIGHTHIANGPQMLAEGLTSKYKDIPKKGKSELIQKWKEDFKWKTSDRLYDIIFSREAPSVKERAWLKKHIDLYYNNYQGKRSRVHA